MFLITKKYHYIEHNMTLTWLVIKRNVKLKCVINLYLFIFNRLKSTGTSAAYHGNRVEHIKFRGT